MVVEFSMFFSPQIQMRLKANFTKLIKLKICGRAVVA